jgi:hypothetical protein
MREVETTLSGEVARDELGAVSGLACNALRARAFSAAHLAVSAAQKLLMAFCWDGRTACSECARSAADGLGLRCGHLMRGSSSSPSVVNLIYCSITVNHRLTGPGKMVKLCLLFMGKFQIQKFD